MGLSLGDFNPLNWYEKTLKPQGVEGKHALNPYKMGPDARLDFNLPSYDRQFGQYSDLYRGIRGGITPQAAGSAYRDKQNLFGQQLRQEAQGRGLGQQIVRMQAQQAADQGARQQLAQQASAGPTNQAMALRNAALNTGNIQSAVGGQAANAGAQMQLGAMNQYGGFLSGVRGQDENLAVQNAQLGQNAMALRQQGMLEALRQRAALSAQQQAGGMNYQQNLTNRYGMFQQGGPTGRELQQAQLGDLLTLGLGKINTSGGSVSPGALNPQYSYWGAPGQNTGYSGPPGGY